MKLFIMEEVLRLIIIHLEDIMDIIKLKVIILIILMVISIKLVVIDIKLVLFIINSMDTKFKLIIKDNELLLLLMFILRFVLISLIIKI